MNTTLEKIISTIGIIILSPFLVVFLLFIYLEDKSESPIFKQKRVGKKGKIFDIYKLRTMRTIKDINFKSTSLNDPRILKTGDLARKIKFDEIPQLINIILGTMSFVGPRPNVIEDVNKYNNFEKNLLSVNPGITDPSSIIFSDESEILSNYQDPDNAYNEIIRPWKNLFALRYLKNRNTNSDFLLIFLTLFAKFNRKLVLKIIAKILKCKKYSISYKVVTRTIKLEDAIIEPPKNINLP